MELFEPGRIGKLQIKNRIVMPAMAISGLAEPDGSLSSRAIDYYVARAKGGAGLITVGVTRVENEIENHDDAELFLFALRIDKQAHVSQYSVLADAVHDYGAKLSIQLTAGWGAQYPLGSRSPVSSSARPCSADPSVMARELTTVEIKKLVRAFGLAAGRAKDAGIDAIEVHAHAQYLFEQFQSALLNKRKDKYGGDLEGRFRFPLEVIASIKAAVGKDFPVIYRYGIKSYIEGGRDVAESQEMARRLEQAGVNAIHASSGGGQPRYHPPAYQPPGHMVEFAEAVKEAVTIPVIAVSRLGYPELANRVLREGRADFIALGRPLLADPEWPNKVREGRLDDIRPCIGCNEGCFGRVFKNKYVSCAVNPTTGMEREFALKPAERRKSVLVVGGGPGGMEAARVAALRGHQVTLWEKSDQLGGNLIPSSVPDFKKDQRSLIDYLSTQIRKLGVDIRLGSVATPEMVQQMAPQVVIIATGATPIIPEIPGVDKSIVATATDILLGKKEAGETIVVVGGDLIGCEVAVFLAEKSHRVTLVEVTDALAPDIYQGNRNQLLDMLAQTNVEILTNTTVSEITDDGVVINGKSGEKRKLKADRVVLAMGLKPYNELQRALEGKVAEVHAIGDCVEARKIIDAIWGGFRTARLI